MAREAPPDLLRGQECPLSLHLQHQSRRVFQAVLDADEEGDGFLAIDKAVVVADVEKVRRARKFRPLFFIDIAVPRDIDPAVGEIEEVYLYDIDTLEQLAEEARKRRLKQIEECEKIIDAELAKLNLPGV